MKKKIMILSVSVMIMATLSGCGIIPELPELSQDQEALITEYAAGLLLKYDKAYDNGLLSEKELITAEAKEKEQQEKAEKQRKLAEEYVAKSNKAKEEKEKSDNKKEDTKDSEEQTVAEGPVIISSEAVGAFLGISNIDIAYTGYDETTSYPNDGNNGFSIDASNGNRLVVTKFRISNSSDSESDIDLFDQSMIYNLMCSDGTSYPCCTTWLTDDLSIYKNTLKAKAGEDTVLIFEVPNSKDLSGATINIVTEGGKASLNL